MARCTQNKIAICFIGLACLFFGCKQKAPQREPYLLNKEDKDLFQSGDIILRKGEGFISQFICDRLKERIPISHCGIIIKDADKLDVIHALSKDVSEVDGVQICSFDQFTQESEKGSIFVVRYKKDTTALIASSALYYLRTKKPFDRFFDLHDSTAFFCSELPLHILKYHLHRDLAQDLSIPPFSLFLNPNDFAIIYPRQ